VLHDLPKHVETHEGHDAYPDQKSRVKCALLQSDEDGNEGEDGREVEAYGT
jgi:hypothetical protein